MRVGVSAKGQWIKSICIPYVTMPGNSLPPDINDSPSGDKHSFFKFSNSRYFSTFDRRWVFSPLKQINVKIKVNESEF